MRKFILILLLYGTHAASAQLFKTDTFAYSINLDASVNNYLKTLPVDLLKGYCSGKWNAYYPKYEYNQCLWNDYLMHYQTANNNEQNLYCIDDYCSQPYFKALYDNFTRKIGYKEIYYFDAKHSVIKRELLSIQLYYSFQDFKGEWIHVPSLIFWLKEINAIPNAILISNKKIRWEAWTLEKEFATPGFIRNENPQKTNQQKETKIQDIEER